MVIRWDKAVQHENQKENDPWFQYQVAYQFCDADAQRRALSWHRENVPGKMSNLLPIQLTEWRQIVKQLGEDVELKSRLQQILMKGVSTEHFGHYRCS